MGLSSTLLWYMICVLAIKRLSPTIESLSGIRSETSRELLRLLSSISLIEMEKVDLEH